VRDRKPKSTEKQAAGGDATAGKASEEMPYKVKMAAKVKARRAHKKQKK
jgi:hypothetical protein